MAKKINLGKGLGVGKGKGMRIWKGKEQKLGRKLIRENGREKGIGTGIHILSIPRSFSNE